MKSEREALSVRGAVVVGVDMSRAGTQALHWAADQAALEQRPLVVVRATGGLGTAGTTWLDSENPAKAPTIDKVPGEGASVADPAAQRARELHPGLVVGTYVATEDPAPELRRLTAEAHLVVVGSRGNSLLRHLPTWQIGSRVAGRAVCPVVVVPAFDADSVRQGVLVGHDLTKRSEPVLRFAYDFAALHQQPLIVTHVTRERRDQQQSERLLAESVAGFREEFPDVHAHLQVIHGSPTTVLLRMADRRHLLVVGQHHELGAYESPVRHVHASIVDRTPCPVAVVPVDPQCSRQARHRCASAGEPDHSEM
jgi:nucleotide-binding universal stress UspA family protein